jgi:hypothetical protein
MINTMQQHTGHWDALAKAAYAAYAQVTEWKNYQGYQMPQYENLSEKIQQAWIAACKEVVRVSKNHLLANIPPAIPPTEDK